MTEINIEILDADKVIESKELHPVTVEQFVKKLKQKYHNVRKNNLLPFKMNGKATRKDAVYQPDILVEDEKDNITHIVEIETKDGGKSMIGALFLADACIYLNIKANRQDSSIIPELVFVILGNKDNAIKRENALESHLKSISHIKYHFCTWEEAHKILKI